MGVIGNSNLLCFTYEILVLAPLQDLIASLALSFACTVGPLDCPLSSLSLGFPICKLPEMRAKERDNWAKSSENCQDYPNVSRDRVYWIVTMNQNAY